MGIDIITLPQCTYVGNILDICKLYKKNQIIKQNYIYSEVDSKCFLMHPVLLPNSIHAPNYNAQNSKVALPMYLELRIVFEAAIYCSIIDQIQLLLQVKVAIDRTNILNKDILDILVD